MTRSIKGSTKAVKIQGMIFLPIRLNPDLIQVMIFRLPHPPPLFKPFKVKAGEAKVVEAKVVEAKVFEDKAVEDKVVETKVVETKVVEAKVVNAKVVKVKALETKANLATRLGILIKREETNH